MRSFRQSSLRFSDRARRTGLAVGLTCAVVGSLATLAPAEAAAPLRPSTPPTVEPSAITDIEYVGGVEIPSIAGNLGSPVEVVGSPDHTTLYYFSNLHLYVIDVASQVITRQLGYNASEPLDSRLLRILDVVVSADGSTAYFLYSSNDGTSPTFSKVGVLDLTTGVLGTPIDVADGSVDMTRGSMALADGGATPMLYVYLSAYGPPGSLEPSLFEIDLATSTVASITDLTPRGLVPSSSLALAASADGTELYAGTATSIGVYDVTNLSNYARTIAVPGSLLVVRDDTPDTDDKGQLYAAAAFGNQLRSIDPDNSDSITYSLTTVPSVVSALSVDADGNAITGYQDFAGIEIFDAAGNLVASPANTSATSSTSAAGQSVWVDADPTFGSCYFVADGVYQSIGAYAVDGADCGAFAPPRFDPVEGPLAVDGTLEVTYDADWAGGRAEPWAGIVVFVDCQPARVIRPPLSGSEEIRWRDLPLGTSIQIRAYTATQLSALELADLDDVTCSSNDSATPSADQLDLGMEYLPLQATAVVGGDNFSCALADGLAYCWGDGAAGTLGDGAPEPGPFSGWDDSPVFRPVALPGIVDTGTTPVTITPDTSGGQLEATAISSTSRHVCALADSSIVCWGLNSDGQLGVGPTKELQVDSVTSSTAGTLALPNDPGNVNVPVPAVASNGFTNTAVTAIAAGDDHSCAVENGTVFCWGRNQFGQLGDGTTDSTDMAVQVSAGGGFTNTDVTALAAGFDHTCAIENGSIYCWGSNSNGSLGDGTTSNRLEPVKVVANDGFVNMSVTDVAASDRSTCALAGGSVYCWGSDDAGKLGDGDPSYTNSPVPKKVIDVVDEGFTNSGVTAIGAGEDHICAVAGGSVFCWGLNGDDQLGRPSPYSTTSALKVPDVIDEETDEVIFANTGVLAVGGGYDHTCAVTEAGAFCWGENGQGRLGRGLTTSGDFAPGPVCCGRPTDGGGGGNPPPSSNPGPVVRYDLDVEIIGDGSVASDVDGIECPDACIAAFRSGTEVTLTATPTGGQQFVGWGGACSGASVCVVTMNAMRSVTATFARIPVVDLTVAINGGGSVRVGGVSCATTCTVSVDRNEQVTLTAVPEPGSVFLGWEGPCSGTGVCVVSVAEVALVTASFGPVPTLPATGGSPWLVVVALGVLALGLLAMGLAFEGLPLQRRWSATQRPQR